MYNFFTLAHARKPKFGLFFAVSVPIFLLPFSSPFFWLSHSRYFLLSITFLAAVKSWVLISGKAFRWKLDRLLVQWTISTQSDQPCFTFFDLGHQNAMDSPKKVSWRYVFPSSIACLSRIPSDVWIDDVTNGTKCMTPQSAQMRA